VRGVTGIRDVRVVPPEERTRVVAMRCTHARNGIINRRDFDQMVDLLVAMLQKLDGPAVQRLRDFTPEP
jgi:hypothetical protein